MRREQTGRLNDDGTPAYNYIVEDSDPVGDDGLVHIVGTGPAMGAVVLADGTIVDVTPAYVAVASAEQRTEVAHHIGVQLETAGVIAQHTDCDHCDAPKTADGDPLSPQAREQFAGFFGHVADASLPSAPDSPKGI